jgi:hypothetical protein
MEVAMKKLFVLLIILIIALPSFSQENNNRKGKKAIQFDFDSFSLTRYPVHGIGGKYWLRDNFAMKAGLKFEKQTQKEKYQYKPTDEFDYSILKLQLLIEKHYKSFSGISPFIGGKIGFLYSGYTQVEEWGTTKVSELGYLIGALFGVEYWINKYISLSGYHSIDFDHSTYNEEDVNSEKLEMPKTKVHSSTSSLILSVYF